jgi:nicotinamidase-related amidase
MCMAHGTTAGSRPYRWPWHGVFDPHRTALLVVRDGDFAPPGQSTGALLTSLAELGARAGLMIVDLPARVETAFAGADIQVVRPHYGGFSGTDLDVTLRRHGRTDLIFVGFPFELGADTTMRQANDLGYECLAVTDCCTGLSPETLSGAIASIQMSGGIFGAVTEAAGVLDLLGRAIERAATELIGVT